MTIDIANEAQTAENPTSLAWVDYFYAGGEGFAPGSRVISSTNRNFEGRQGPGIRTHIASPATVAASAVAGAIASPADLPEIDVRRPLADAVQ